MRNWVGDDEEKRRVAGYIRIGLQCGGVVESAGFYFTTMDRVTYLCCTEAIALIGMLGDVRSAHAYFYDHRTKYTGNMSPWQDFADLLRINPVLARQIDRRHARGMTASTIADELMGVMAHA